ncbi:hypothetical protein BY458DRAFT_513404 [Sporodiniella umbellata]|nr:hypothetical protein BY458DRAFT_513404 [Sporodiniella umbellata]
MFSNQQGFGTQTNTGFGNAVGAPAPSSQPPSVGFNFGSSQPASSTSSFNFGASQPATATSTPAFGFGTSQPAAATSTPAFGFGASQPTTTTPFKFGSSQATTATTTATPSFGLGTAQPAATTFGGPQQQNTMGLGAANQPNAAPGLLDLKNCFPETGGPHFIIRSDGITRSAIAPNVYTAEPELADYNDQYNLSSVPFTFSSPKPKELPRYLTSGLLTPGNGKRRTIDELVTKMNEKEDKNHNNPSLVQHVPQYKPEPKTSKNILAEKNTDPYRGFYRNLQKDVIIA